jgi:TfoX/Sxy family transcriptional regulator of competence genes
LDTEFIRELFTPFRPVTVRRMFGGAGIFCEGLMFALVFDGAIYLKVDEACIPDFEREGSKPFVYTAPKVPAASAAPRSHIGGCRSGFTTIPTSSRSGRRAR